MDAAPAVPPRLSDAIPAPVQAAPRRSARADAKTRLLAGLGALLCLSVLLVGAWLNPDASGHGTHTQLGLAQCGWVIALGKPCPTCGMTTAVSHAAHGRLWASLVTQPFGLLVALGLAGGFWVGLYTAATGSHAGRVYGTLLRPRVLWTLAGLALAAWAYKWAVWPTG